MQHASDTITLLVDRPGSLCGGCRLDGRDMGRLEFGLGRHLAELCLGSFLVEHAGADKEDEVDDAEDPGGVRTNERASERASKRERANKNERSEERIPDESTNTGTCSQGTAFTTGIRAETVAEAADAVVFQPGGGDRGSPGPGGQPEDDAEGEGGDGGDAEVVLGEAELEQGGDA